MAREGTGDNQPLPSFAKQSQPGWVSRTIIKVKNKCKRASRASHHELSAKHKPAPSSSLDKLDYKIPALQLPVVDFLNRETVATVKGCQTDTVLPADTRTAPWSAKQKRGVPKEPEGFTSSMSSITEISLSPLALSKKETPSCLTTSLRSTSSSVSIIPLNDKSSTSDNLISTQSSAPCSFKARNGVVVEETNSNTPHRRSVATSPTSRGVISDLDSEVGIPAANSPKPKIPIRIALESSYCEVLPLSKARSYTPQEKFHAAMHKLKMKMIQKLILSLKLPKTPDSVHEPTQQDMDDRCQWGIIRSIENTVLKNLLLESLPEGRKKAAARIRGKSGGAYHHVVYLDAMDLRARKEDFVIKIPGHGTPDRWRPEDEYMLVREAETMQFLFKNTTMPVPEIIAYSGTLENTVGFPYIIMTRLPGQSADKIWFEQPFDTNNLDSTADFPSLSVETKRLNFLRSLAEHMTKLQDIPFSAIGMPSFEDYQLAESQPRSHIFSVDKTFVWPYTSDVHKVEERPASMSTQDFVHTALDQLPDIAKHDDCDDDEKTLLGIRKILDMVFSHSVFQSSPTDTFILQHDDLDFQNILTDSEGNVTGIIDWDGSLAMPRCVASAAVPKFLRRDYFPGHLFRRLHMYISLPHYREIYAAAMSEAGNPDAKFTTKSAIYQAAFASIYEGGSIYDLSEKLVSLVMSGRACKAKDFLIKLGDSKGWEAMECFLQKKLNEILEPELNLTTWEQVKAKLADRAALDWMADFAGINELNESEIESS